MKNGKKYKILFSKVAVKDKTNLINAGLGSNCKKILDLLEVDPFGYPPSYEELVGELNGYYSRRINHQHRIVYTVMEEKHEIHIIRMWAHYNRIK